MHTTTAARPYRKETKATRTARFYSRLSELGLSYNEIEILRLAEKRLRRWAELECGDGNDYASWGIERDETTGKPYMVTHPHQGKSSRRRIADREAGALKRVQAVIAAHPDLWYYHQGDPRGASLYVGRITDIPPECAATGTCPFSARLEQYYTRGVAVCVD